MGCRLASYLTAAEFLTVYLFRANLRSEFDLSKVEPEFEDESEFEKA